MHPLIQEICRASLPIQSHVLRRWQRVLRDEIQPQLDRQETEEPAPALAGASAEGAEKSQKGRV